MAQRSVYVWRDFLVAGPPLTVVGVIPDLKERTFFIHLLISCARQYGLFMLGRPEWFMAISPNLYKVIILHSITALHVQ